MVLEALLTKAAHNALQSDICILYTQASDEPDWK